jgi:site-specific recombinase XerD
MMTELKRWRLACPKNRLQLVFPNESGKPMNYSNAVNRYFKPALKKQSCRSIRWHDLRHTFASLMIHQGENIKYIQSQLGSLIANGDIERLFSPDESGQSGVCLSARKHHFFSNR